MQTVNAKKKNRLYYSSKIVLGTSGHSVPLFGYMTKHLILFLVLQQGDVFCILPTSHPSSSRWLVITPMNVYLGRIQYVHKVLHLCCT